MRARLETNGTFHAPTGRTIATNDVGDAPETSRETATDAYGFALDPDAVATREATRERREDEYWTRARGETTERTLIEAREARDPALKRATRRGVPMDLRCDAWFAASGARELMRMGPTEGYYEKLLLMRVDEKVVDQIELDLARTFPANARYERDANGVEGNDVLRRMLYAYARHNRKTGYCQGMNYIAAFLWLVMGDEEKAFWTFTALLDVVLPNDVHARDIKGTISQYKILHKLLDVNAPKVAKHLKELDVDLVMIASKWLLCLFVESFPATTAARVLDCITYEGEKVWFRVAIAMMKMYEAEILSCKSLPDVMLCLKHAYANQTDADALLTFAFERVSLANKTIANYRRIVEQKMYDEDLARTTRNP